MNREFALLGGMGIGAGLMYFLDPDRGRRRRALLIDQAARAACEFEDFLGVSWRDLTQRARGAVAETFEAIDTEPVPDRILADRVRSKMGRCVSHPRNISVTAEHGRVKLAGPVLAGEADALLACAKAVHGVTELENELELHEKPDIPELQGGRELSRCSEINWSPATRLLAGVAGGTLLAFGLRRSFPLACILGTAGLGLLASARAAGNPRTE